MAPVLLNVPCVCNHRPVAYSHLFFTKKFSSIRYVDGEEPSCGPTNRNKEEREREKKPHGYTFSGRQRHSDPNFTSPPPYLLYFFFFFFHKRALSAGGLSLRFRRKRKHFFFRWLRGTKQKVESPRPSFLLLLLSFRRVCVVSQTHSYNFA